MKTSTECQEKSKEELLTIIKQQAIQLTQQAQQITSLNELVNLYRQRQFARKSEKISPEQASLFDEAEMPKQAQAIEEAEAAISIAAYSRKTPGRKPLPKDLPREQRIYDLTGHEKMCDCGHELKHIKDERSEQLEIIPAKIYVIEHIHKKYACKHCEETIKTAPMPKQPIPGSIAGPGLLSHVVVSKFQDHLPLFRQEQMLRRIGVEIQRSTLCLWVIRAHQLLKPMMNMMKNIIHQYDIAYSDETTVQVLKDPNKGVQSKKYMWLFAGGAPDQFCYYYHYHHSRTHDVPLTFFNGYKGYIHCDGYPGYDALATRSSDIVLSGCMYHVRRKFVEITTLTKSTDGVANTVINYISRLAQIETEIKDCTPENKKIIRYEKAKPLLDNMHEYLMSEHHKTYPKSALGQAMTYAINQWPKLLVYLQDGRLENNNNLSERAIKPFVIGRKGWLFADSVTGAEAAATLFSLVETCKHHSIEPYDWFRFVFQQMPLCQSDDEIAALLPFNIDHSLVDGRRN